MFESRRESLIITLVDSLIVSGKSVGTVTNGEGVDETEAGRIRKEWEELKCLSESFVVACESGCFEGQIEQHQ